MPGRVIVLSLSKARRKRVRRRHVTAHSNSPAMNARNSAITTTERVPTANDE